MSEQDGTEATTKCRKSRQLHNGTQATALQHPVHFGSKNRPSWRLSLREIVFP